MDWEDALQLYDQIVDLCPEIQRKGKTMPYTSDNGHMFSLLNKDGELGFRYSKEQQELYIEQFESDYYYSYGAQMRGYVRIPERMLDDLPKLAGYLKESREYVMSLPPGKKKQK